MWEIILQVTVSLIILTFFHMLNLRIYSANKKGIDPVKGLGFKDLSVAKSLELEKQRNQILKNG